MAEHLTDRVDRILELLDVGDQHTTIAHYGFDDDVDFAAAEEWRGVEPDPEPLRVVWVEIPVDTETFAAQLAELQRAFAAFAAAIVAAIAPLAEAVRDYFNNPSNTQEESNAGQLRRVVGRSPDTRTIPTDTGYLRRSDAAVARTPRRRDFQRQRRGS